MKLLMEALLKAQSSIGGVTREKTNTFAHYRYTSSEHLVSVARKALLLNGIVACRRSWTYESEHGLFDKEKDIALKVISEFSITHVESGEFLIDKIEFPALVRKGTPHDKAIACALTTSLAYWLRDVLLLPRVDEPAAMDRRNDNISALNSKLLEVNKNGN